MESVSRVRKCSEPNLTRCQHQLAPATRANHPTQTECRNRRQLWLVVLAQMDIESDGPVLLIVCGYHKARLERGGGIVAAEQVTTKREHEHFVGVVITEAAHNKAGCDGMIDASVVHVTSQDGKTYPTIAATCDVCGPVVITGAHEW